MPTPSPQQRHGGFAAVGAFCARRSWWVIIAWIVLIGVFGVFSAQLADQLKPGGFEIAGSTSDRARDTILTRFTGEFPTSMTVVLEASDTGATEDLGPVADAVTANLRAIPDTVGRVFAPLPGGSGRTTFIMVGLRVGIDEALNQADRLIRAAQAAATPAVSVGVTGPPAVFTDFDTVNEEDLTKSELVQLPIVLLILVLVLGSLIAASLPIITTVAALTVTLGALYFVARGIDLSIYVRNIVPLVGIGVGVDYSLFLVRRFTEELRDDREVAEAVTITVRTSGRAIFFSGLTVIVALAGMFAVGVPIFTGFAVGSIAVVAIAMLAGLTLVPAVLAVLGHRVFRFDIGLGRERQAAATRRWTRWAEAVMRRPWPYLLGSSALLLALAVPAIWLDLGSSGVTALPRDVPSIQAADVVARDLGAAANPTIRVVVDAPRAPDARGIADLRSAIAADPGIASLTPARPSDDGRAVLFEAVTPFNEDTAAAQDLVARIEDDIVPGVAALSGASVYLGGAASQNRDFNNTVARSLPRVIAIVMALTFLVLVILFRSLLLPLKAVVMTLLSALAAYGVLVMVFQWGWGDSLLGFEHLGHVTSWVPPFLFSILFGLSMDYEVFLLARVREHYDIHGDDRAAVAWGLARSGGIITAAAAIMIVVFLSFLLNRLVPLKESALGLAVAVFLDATIVRIILVPAFMRIAGQWNWWLPGWLDRILPSAHKETA